MKGDFPENIEYGYCHCGCGEKTTITPCSWMAKGWVKGEPRKYLRGHNTVHGKDNIFWEGERFGKKHPNWKGGAHITDHGHTKYVRIFIPAHPRSNTSGYVYEHILVAEKMNGGSLSDKAVVHRIDGDGLNNNEDNLMIFKNVGAHTSFHAKLRRNI